MAAIPEQLLESELVGPGAERHAATLGALCARRKAHAAAGRNPRHVEAAFTLLAEQGDALSVGLKAQRSAYPALAHRPDYAHAAC